MLSEHSERQDELVERVRELEREMFPEFAAEDFCILQQNAGKPSYALFAPNHHFKKGLVTAEDLEEFAGHPEKRLLSVGAGPAYLERILVRMGVAPESIVLADKDLHSSPETFERMEFDMHEEWPDMGDATFERILFPESVLLNVRNDTDKDKRRGLEHILRSSLDRLSPNGIVRIDGHSQKAENLRRVIASLDDTGHLEVGYDRSLITLRRSRKPVENIQLETAAKLDRVWD